MSQENPKPTALIETAWPPVSPPRLTSTALRQPWPRHSRPTHSGSLGISGPRGPGGLVALLQRQRPPVSLGLGAGTMCCGRALDPPGRHRAHRGGRGTGRTTPGTARRPTSLRHHGACRTVRGLPPEGRPHYYLSLLGTRPDYRGRGLGFGLLAKNLAIMDAEGVPAYLESTNPDNNPRYERFGFGRWASSRRLTGSAR